MSDRTMLVCGASGVIGQAAVEHVAARGDTRVIALSRRAPDVPSTLAVEHLPLDLLDEDACREAASQLSGVTHLVYACTKSPDWSPVGSNRTRWTPTFA